MKDYYDIWLLSCQFNFNLYDLKKGIELTFQNRNNSIQLPIDGFKKTFIIEHQVMWIAFIKRLNLEHVPEDLNLIIADIKDFLLPVLEDNTENLIWYPEAGWK